MLSEFEAKVLGRVGRGHLPDIKLLGRTLRWQMARRGSELQLVFVAALSLMRQFPLRTGFRRSKTPRTKATGSGARDALKSLDAFQTAVYRTAVGMIGYTVLDRPDCQFAAKTVMSSTREPRKLDWMRHMRLAKFLMSHDEVEWIMLVQDVPDKYVAYGDSDWGGSEPRWSTSGTFEHSRPSQSTAAGRNTS